MSRFNIRFELRKIRIPRARRGKNVQVSWKLKSACLRIRARVDKGAATLCAALSRCVDQWSKTRGVTAMETRPRSTVHRSPKFPPNYRRTRFKRTLIGLAAVERDEISREERRSLLPPSFSLFFTPFTRWSSVNENLNLSGRGNWVHQDGNGGWKERGREGRWIVKKTTSWRSDLWVKREDSFFPFFCPGRRDTACSMLADKNGRVRWTQHAGCIKDLISFGALPFNGMFSIAMFPLYIGLIHAHEANRATSIRFAFLDL